MARESRRSRRCHVQRLYIEDRAGRKCRDVTVDAPTVQQVLAAVRELNGDNTTMVILEMEGKQFGIAGGTRGRYLGELTYGIDDAFYTLLSSADPAKASEEEIELVSGGQEVIVPRRQVLDLKTVLKASRHFAEHGRMCSSLIWRKHG